MRFTLGRCQYPKLYSAELWEINEKLIRKDVEGSGRGLILCTIPEFAYRNRGKTREN
jgi:hypothetical protein